mmetsp:Transcript_1824/g.2681  ORF Transcript_1824/g.2681 Transcript_1824/m.2681 type:complete len:317 (+) Transcript_1824:54-1004(+)|eukprot:CAMPEP_0194567702 /NCGR_PEP_ID=MMETSP0292-20121207/6065_1 /TAXON_ID=39354 /ORGANISM="Heterosigma akashiwo, Strain CCMP2393" /LENGTH=316 /DNA_ID=CAMNT_0039417511 /DNA_START=46 /DNA_END=996 /DNA_ORIENTATION=+
MAWSRDGILAMTLKASPTYGLNNLTASESSMAYITGSEIAIPHLSGEFRSIPLQDDVKCHQVKFVSLNNVTMLVLAMDAGVQIWNAGGTRMVFYLPLDGIIESSPEEMKYCRGIAGVPNGEYIFVGTFTGDVLVITVQVEGGDDRIEFLQALPGHASAVTACAASEVHVCSADDRGTILCRDVTQGFLEVAAIEGQGFPVTSLAIHGDLVAASYSTGHIRFFQISTGDLVCEISAHSRGINAIAIHPNEQMMISCGDDQMLNIWSLPELDATGISLLHQDCVEDRLLTGCCFLADERKQIAVTSYDHDLLYMWGRT